MANLLRIDSSSRIEDSHSRKLADYFQASWLRRYPDTEVLVRDTIKTPAPHLSDITIAGFYTLPEQQTEEMKQALVLSDQLISELQSADVLLLSVPMYNFSIPSALKAWIDQVVRINQTFAYDGTNFTGLVTVKKAFIICTYGAAGYTDGGPFSSFNFLEPYLKGLLGFLGIPEIHFFNLQATTGDPSVVATNTQRIKQAIDAAISAS